MSCRLGRVFFRSVEAFVVVVDPMFDGSIGHVGRGRKLLAECRRCHRAFVEVALCRVFRVLFLYFVVLNVVSILDPGDYMD